MLAVRMMPIPLPAIMVEPSVRAALLEDLGRAGDLTTDAIVPASARTEMRADGAPARRGGRAGFRRRRVPADRSGDRGASSSAPTAAGWRPAI